MKKQRTYSRTALLLCIALLVAGVSGCSDWEKNTFATLGAAKKAIDAASHDYNAGLIPKTRENYDLLSQAQGAKDLAVQAFYTYWDVKTKAEMALKAGDLSSGEANAKVNAAHSAVAAALFDLGPLLARVAALKH